MDKAAFHDFTVEIIRRSDTAKGFEILPCRWVVERTFGWMIRWRRLVRDYEQRIDVAEAMIHIAMGSLMATPKCSSLKFQKGSQNQTNGITEQTSKPGDFSNPPVQNFQENETVVLVSDVNYV